MGNNFLATSGVPQGSFLVPYLFGIYFADFSTAQQRYKMIKYVYDSHI